MGVFRRLTFFSLALATCTLLPHKAQAWFGLPKADATQELYNIVLQGPPPLSLTDPANQRMAQAEKACSQGADVNYVDDGGMSLLHHAAHLNDLDMVQFLLNKGADPTVRDSGGQQPWVLANKSNQLCTLLYGRCRGIRGALTAGDVANYETLIKSIKEREQQEQGGNGPGLKDRFINWIQGNP